MGGEGVAKRVRGHALGNLSFLYRLVRNIGDIL